VLPKRQKLLARRFFLDDNSLAYFLMLSEHMSLVKSEPEDFKPYYTMLQMLILEAVQSDVDGILLISRTPEANLYFLCHGQVKKMFPFQFEHAKHLFEEMQHLNTPEIKIPGNLDLKCRVVRKEFGDCLLLSIEKLNQSSEVACAF
jgi:hypothetical protein